MRGHDVRRHRKGQRFLAPIIQSEKDVRPMSERAWKLIADENRWTQGSFATNEFGFDVDELDEHATCWCAWGAVNRVHSGKENIDLRRRIVMRYEAEYGLPLATDNDSPGMTAAVMSERLRLIEEQVLAERGVQG